LFDGGCCRAVNTSDEKDTPDTDASHPDFGRLNSLSSEPMRESSRETRLTSDASEGLSSACLDFFVLDFV